MGTADRAPYLEPTESCAMGNKPGNAASTNATQKAMDVDVERVRTSYVRQTSGEKMSAAAFSRELKRDDPKKYYSFGQRLGEGAFGAVDQVTKKSNNKEYACKTINTQAGACKEDMLHREIGTMLKCDHPHLIGIQDVFQHSRFLYIIMDLVESPAPGVCPDLFSWLVEPCGLGDKMATPGQVAKIIYKVASAIKYMNDEMGAIHRDLKPENVLVGPDGIDSLKVTDFGLARLGVDASAGGFVGTFQAGTEGYMAPELIDRSKAVEGKVDYGDEPFKVDIFSLGVLMFICFTKTPPFGLGPSATSMVLRGNYDRNAMAGIRPPQARELCKRMLETNQQDRCSIEEVLADEWLVSASGN